MALRGIVNITDKASTVLGVAGGALSTEQANAAYPEAGNKRRGYTLTATSVGSVASELFIENINAFRVRLAADSVFIAKIFAVYYSAVPASNATFEVTTSATNVNGTITILGVNAATKFGASAATLAVTYNSINGLNLVGTGVVGDTNGRWEAQVFITEVTDLG